MISLPSRTWLARAIARRAAVAALALPMVFPASAFAGNITPPPVPTKIQAPAGHVPYLVGHATGTQNYACQLSPNGYAWTLVAPAATLVGDNGQVLTTHYGGPTWEAKDGSKVVGARVDGETVDPTAIPWLLLRAASKTAGSDGDRLTHTTYIQRVKTVGGLAPTSGCDQTTSGASRNVPYAADYYFYKATGSN
jgi:hypothetical protein